MSIDRELRRIKETLARLPPPPIPDLTPVEWLAVFEAEVLACAGEPNYLLAVKMYRAALASGDEKEQLFTRTWILTILMRVQEGLPPYSAGDAIELRTWWNERRAELFPSGRMLYNGQNCGTVTFDIGLESSIMDGSSQRIRVFVRELREDPDAHLRCMPTKDMLFTERGVKAGRPPDEDY